MQNNLADFFGGRYTVASRFAQGLTMPTQTKLTVTKWSRYTAAEAYQLRLLAAREELSVAMLIRKLSLEGLRRSMLPTTMSARDDEPEQVVGVSA